MKRAFDIVFALLVLMCASPILLVSAIGILLSSPGPMIHVAQRVGKNGALFRMLKFRTMHIRPGGAVITSSSDPRVFPFGAFLRKTKIDEIPQFINVLRGQMSVVGPRPEDPKIVELHYSTWMKETLRVAPGITSAGSIFYYAHGEDLISNDDPESSYVEKLLPPKLAIERAYMDRSWFLTDLHYVMLTIASVVGKLAGFKVEVPLQDLMRARNWIDAEYIESIISKDF
jgi:lipopolysaccharide/colanic/teichoic acid biosynthesis glycosyltransferase